MQTRLTDSEALVLFEWLSQLDERRAFPLEDEAEEYVLWSIHAQLEKRLTEPFRKDYRALVKAARIQVRSSFGAHDD